MKKITILALHLGYGGIEKYISSLCKMFEKDFNVDVISTYKYSEKPAFDFSSNINIKYLTNDYPYKISIKSLVKDNRYFSIIKEMFRRITLRFKAYMLNIKFVKNLKTDYVITTRIYHNKIVNKYLKGSKITKIATEHNYHNNNNKYIREVIRSTTNFDYFIHCTDELYRFYKPLITGPKNVKIYNPVYVNNNIKSKLNNYNIISVGRLSEEKGYLDLINVMREIKKTNSQIRLSICGDGYQKNEIINRIKEYDLEKNIILTGFITGNELVDKYKNASLYVLPSKSEAFGLVLLEAMHYGLPCIAFDSASGARQLLKGGTGVLVKDRNIEEMAEEIITLLNNQKTLKKYSEKSIECVRNYSLDKIYREWEKLFR